MGIIPYVKQPETLIAIILGVIGIGDLYAAFVEGLGTSTE
jgi:hypothetical protein